MITKLLIHVFTILLLLALANSVIAQTVTQYDGEYATNLTTFEYELTSVDDDGWLKFWWGFNTTGDNLRFEIGTSVLSEDYVDVYFDQVYKIPMDVYFNDVELDVNANTTYFDYWEGIFWSRMLLPIEDGQYNNFDILEDQDPATYDVKGDEVSYFTTDSEIVYEYNTGILISWTSTVTYSFTLLYVAPPQVTSEVSTDDEGFLDGVAFASSTVFIGLTIVIFVKKLSNRILKN